MELIGVKRFLQGFKPEIDWEKKAKKKAKEKGVSVEEIKKDWKKKELLGIKIHKKLQKDLENLPNVQSWDILFTNKDDIFSKLPEKDIQLTNGIYLERPCFSHKQRLIGFPDKIEITNNTINIEDYKTFNKLYRTSPSLRIGGKVFKDSYSYPVSYLDSCNYIDTCLQLSIYMYILWENNRSLKVGKLYMTHVIADENENIISINKEEVPYMREEVKKLLDFYKQNNK